MSCYICPVCKNSLELQNRSLKCENNHTYDLAKSGYVNLLLSSQMNSKLPGDNKMMVNSRRDFLDKGYYSVLMKALCNTMLKNAHNGDVILDCGCGEGYYTDNIKCTLSENSIDTNFYGIDISKIAADAAAKRNKDIFYAAASVFHIPLADNSCDIMMSVFAPYSHDEFTRILKNNGIMILVIPSERHLYELKAAVYDKPYLNEVKEYAIDGFELLDCEKIKDTINLSSNEDIKNLFTMTPYYYKTSADDQAKLDALETLDTEISFEILTYKKK